MRFPQSLQIFTSPPDSSRNSISTPVSNGLVEQPVTAGHVQRTVRAAVARIAPAQIAMAAQPASGEATIRTLQHQEVRTTASLRGG
jgi:hypothetical protein